MNVVCMCTDQLLWREHSVIKIAAFTMFTLSVYLTRQAPSRQQSNSGYESDTNLLKNSFSCYFSVGNNNLESPLRDKRPGPSDWLLVRRINL